MERSFGEEGHPWQPKGSGVKKWKTQQEEGPSHAAKRSDRENGPDNLRKKGGVRAGGGKELGGEKKERGVIKGKRRGGFVGGIEKKSFSGRERRVGQICRPELPAKGCGIRESRLTYGRRHTTIKA